MDPNHTPAPMLQFFDYEHLAPDLREICGPIGDLARFLDTALPRSAEKTQMFRKLLEARDCAVRAAQL